MGGDPHCCRAAADGGSHRPGGPLAGSDLFMAQDRVAVIEEAEAISVLSIFVKFVRESKSAVIEKAGAEVRTKLGSSRSVTVTRYNSWRVRHPSSCGDPRFQVTRDLRVGVAATFTADPFAQSFRPAAERALRLRTGQRFGISADPVLLGPLNYIMSRHAKRV